MNSVKTPQRASAIPRTPASRCISVHDSKVKDWKGQVPTTVTVASKELASGKDFNASVKERTLLVQILTDVKEEAKISIE